jgi:hypothetical protein
MPRNGSGTYTIPNTFSASTTIQSSAVNANNSDIGSEITASLPRNGEAAMTGQFKATTGTAAAPSITFSTDTNSGFYRKSGDVIGIAVGGVEVATINSTGFQGGGALPSGTKMLFAQAAAPVGWTKDTTEELDNSALRLVTDVAGDGGDTGGTADFSDVFSEITLVIENIPEHTHSSGDLSVGNEATHEHNYLRYTSLVGVANGAISNVWKGTQSVDTTAGDVHSHTISGSTGSAGSAVPTPLDFDVKYLDIILAAKD